MSVNQKELLAATIRQYNLKGWSPATATNYSFQEEDGTIWVSRSGIDKSQFSANDFMTVDSNGNATGEFAHMKPSAETLIHCVIYTLFPETKVILHSHSIYPILISAVLGHQISFEGYEIQKGFDGQTTHESYIDIPIFENTQDMQTFKAHLMEGANRIQQHAFIIRKHGTYAWGKNLFEAKRHLETLDYLCQCEWMLKNA
ncbi:MAG: methylthioribulose 1-phosphate dehydratase [Bacteroidota bacterium]|jgi:methylthioribulose-1-phosphate dehydratase